MKRHKYISDGVVWKNKPGEPRIQSPGDILAMMSQGNAEPAEEAAAHQGEPAPVRKAIISIHGKDVEECEVPETRKDKDRAA